MPKIKTSELQGAALDWVVAKCEGPESYASAYLVDDKLVYLDEASESTWEPSTSWAQGGPIIDRVGISIIRCDNDYGLTPDGFCDSKHPIPVWAATTGHHTIHGDELYVDAIYYGSTALIAAMRCYVACNLGDAIDVPEELVS